MFEEGSEVCSAVFNVFDLRLFDGEFSQAFQSEFGKFGRDCENMSAALTSKAIDCENN